MFNILSCLMMQEYQSQKLYKASLDPFLFPSSVRSVEMYLLYDFVLLYSFCVVTVFSDPVSNITSPPSTLCRLRNSFQPGFEAHGDFIIGGMFPLHFNQEMPDLNNTYRPPPVKCNG